MNSPDRGIKFVAAYSMLPLMVAFGASCTNPSTELPSSTTIAPTSSPFVKETPLPSPIPAATLPPPKDTPRSPTPTAKPASTASPAPEGSGDAEIKRQVEQAKGGQIVVINRGKVGLLTRYPWITGTGIGTAIFATLNTENNGKKATAAVLFQADCLHRALEEQGVLGVLRYNSWMPNVRVDSMRAKVSAPTTVVSSVPLLDLEEITFRGKPYICHEVTAGERLKNFLSGVNWQSAPEDLAESLAREARRVFDAIRRGFGNP